ncbi:MAG: DUF1499 domain-containing protein [Spirochaetaceae bacterium]
MKVLIVIVVIIVLMALFMVVKNNKVPADLGVNDGKLAPMPKSPNAVSSQSDDPEKKVDPIPFKGDLNQSKEWIKKALEVYGNISIVKDESNYIHAVNTTSKMKYNDDIEFYFDEEVALIHFRSASRVGYSDIGLNRQRYDKLLELLK